MLAVEIERTSVLDVGLLRQVDHRMRVEVSGFTFFVSDLDFKVLLENTAQVFVKRGWIKMIFVREHEFFRAEAKGSAGRHGISYVQHSTC